MEHFQTHHLEKLQDLKEHHLEHLVKGEMVPARFLNFPIGSKAHSVYLFHHSWHKDKDLGLLIPSVMVSHLDSHLDQEVCHSGQYRCLHLGILRDQGALRWVLWQGAQHRCCHSRGVGCCTKECSTPRCTGMKHRDS